MGRRISRFLLLALLAILLTTSVAPVSRVEAAAATITPSNADTYLSNPNPLSSIFDPTDKDRNFGDLSALLVDPGNGGDDSNLRRSLVKFSLSSLPAGSIINSAHLRLRVGSIGWTDDPTGETLNVYQVTEDWDEMQATWNSRLTGTAWTGTNPAGSGGTWTATGAASATIPSNSTGYWIDWTVTTIVKAWVENSQPNYGFIIDSPSSKDWTISFGSKEDTSAWRPTLLADYTPPSQASVATATGTGTATFQTSAGGFSSLTAVAEGSLPSEGKPDLQFPHGFFQFTITDLAPGASVTVTITLPSAVPVGTQYWKYGPEPGNLVDHWYQIPIGDDNGDNVITITLTDNGRGDDILTGTDSQIVDQGGPGSPGPTSPAGAPVGGFMEPVNKLAIVTPYVALFGLVATVAVVIAKPWKKPEN
jgi:hypothetical protein